jgi:3-oxoacyl-[acyl-carrier protein] reductase
MNTSSLLRGKRAVIFGAGGSIGAVVAKEFAAEGADVYLSGRSKSKVDAIARDISAIGGRAHVAVVDVTDPVAVEAYVDTVILEAGGIDAVFNAAGPSPGEYGNGKLGVELSPEEFSVPFAQMVRPQFITARAAARRMTGQRSGVILFQSGSPARGHVNGGVAIGTAFGAIETLAENLAFEVSPLGVRVLCLRTTANADSVVIQQTIDVLSERMGRFERRDGG